MYSQLVYAAKGAHVTTLIVNGRLVDRKMTTLDEVEVLEHAEKIRGRIEENLKARANH